MKLFFQLFCVLLVWFFSLINDSGFGQANGTFNITYTVLCVASICTFFSKKLYAPIWPIRQSRLLMNCCLFFFILIPLFFGGSTVGLEYLSCVLTVYCFSFMLPSKKMLFLSGIIIALLGLYIIYEFLYGSMRGWNENTIAMIGLFSYLYYAISLFGETKRINKLLGFLLTGAYVMMFQMLTNRSCLFALILAITTIFFRSYTIRHLERPGFRRFILNLPLIVALLACLIGLTDLMHSLDSWSRSEYGKPFFNGRDQLWSKSLIELFDSGFLGIWHFKYNYHNSAIACLSVFGIFGYITWICVFSFILKCIIPYLRDIYVYGCICAFLIIFIQQSTELGFIRECPNMVPYMILGLAIGRVQIAYDEFDEKEEYEVK